MKFQSTKLIVVTFSWVSPCMYFPIILLYYKHSPWNYTNFQFISVFALELQSLSTGKSWKYKHIMQIQRLGLEGFGSQILVNVKQSSTITHRDEI